MKNWQVRTILFLIAGAGCILSMQYSISHFILDRQTILLNTTRPDFQDLLRVEKRQAAIIPRGGLKDYFNYFHLVTKAMPDNAQGQLMLGYLYEITGDKKEARIFLKKAYLLDPLFFFTAFDLALVLFEQGEYAQSAGLLQKALAMAPDSTLQKMMSSIIYRQILSSMKDGRDIVFSLQQAYHDAYVLLIESLAKQKSIQGENVGPQVHAHIM